MFKLLGLAGSIRRASVSKAILQTLAEKVPVNVSLTLHDLAEIPIYNQDLESNLPASVAKLRQAIIDCDGMVIVSPEYNHGMSGVIKNAIDWVSRPGYASVLVNKGVAIITTSESPLGGARAQADLHKMFLSTLSRIAPGREVSIGNTQKTVVDGKLVDETQIRRALTLIDALLAEISMVQGRK
jgi:chromate reductase, NAD(P)H dehydrogenase (quinone)